MTYSNIQRKRALSVPGYLSKVLMSGLLGAGVAAGITAGITAAGAADFDGSPITIESPVAAGGHFFAQHQTSPQASHQVRALVDARDATSPDIIRLIKARHPQALEQFGLLADGQICRQLGQIALDVKEAQESRLAAIKGLGLCRIEASADLLRQMLTGDRLPSALRSEALYALGFQAKKSDLPLMAALYQPTAKHIQALMQAVVYARASVEDVKGLDWQRVAQDMQNLAVITELLYFLGRLQGVEDVIPFDKVQAAYKIAQDHDLIDAQLMALRVLAKYDAVQPMFTAMLAGIDGCQAGSFSAPDSFYMRRRMAVLQYAPAYEGADWQNAVTGALASRCVPFQKAALDYVIRRDMAVDYSPLVQYANASVAMTALAGLYQRDQSDPEKQMPIRQQLISHLTGHDYFKAYKALSVLAADDKGKEALSKALDTVRFATLKKDAAYILTPNTVISSWEKRPTPQLTGEEKPSVMVLQTTKGLIEIELHSDSYAAVNFRDLVKAGRLNGMIWHRVIPNFVAQAGQTPQDNEKRWPTIRDEWTGKKHTIGTVGLATAGKDTGSSQFFINTNYNQHLDNRYTVFGHVIKGMDHVFQMMEGDQIIRAEIKAKK